jgi:hypothetical protein
MERRDLADPEMLAAIARVTRLAPEEAGKRYETVCA